MESNNQQLVDQFEEACKEAASIIICNWTNLNMAIELGFSEKNKKFNSEGEQEIEALRNLIGTLGGERKNDIAKRIELINMMVDLCVAEEIEIMDFEDCIMDFMEFQFNVILEDDSARDIGNILMKIRNELLKSMKEGKFESQELQKLRDYNEKKKQQIKDKKKSESNEEEKQEETKQNTETKPKGPTFDDDGFEVVTTEKGRRKK